MSACENELLYASYQGYCSAMDLLSIPYLSGYARAVMDHELSLIWDITQEGLFFLYVPEIWYITQDDSFFTEGGVYGDYTRS